MRFSLKAIFLLMFAAALLFATPWGAWLGISPAVVPLGLSLMAIAIGNMLLVGAGMYALAGIDWLLRKLNR
ncbi:MAG: hypothetical protein SGJ19_15970 [Planctomycetia bacterium]|nr:hypothetical protein [Planctomycetia bacterium]